MPVYYYLIASDSRATQSKVLAFTHNDTFKTLPGYQVTVSHFHTVRRVGFSGERGRYSTRSPEVT